MPDSEYEIPNDPNITSGDIERGADLCDADLSETNLSDANLFEADLTGADLTAANLSDANLSHANLFEVDLTGANLIEANLSDTFLVHATLTDAYLLHANLNSADLSTANLTGADLTNINLTDAKLSNASLTDTNLLDANLTDANLQGADLTGANLHGVDLTGATLARSTQIDAPGERIQSDLVGEDSISEELQYDIIARTNHELRTAYSANGLIGRARRARIRERRARRREAFAEGGARGYTAWFGSLLSKVFTGYGVQLTWITAVIAALYLVSAGVYHFVGEMSVGRSLYYSVVTFTTSPPETPPPGLTSIVAAIETFAGTAAIVFLGYVLGTRERV